MHTPFTGTLQCVVRQHFQEGVIFSLRPQIHHPQIDLLVEFSGDSEGAVISSVEFVFPDFVGQRTGCQQHHFAVAFTDRFSNRFTQHAGVVQVVNGAPCSDGHHFELAFRVHKVQRNQGAVLQIQRLNLMRQGVNALFGGAGCNGITQIRVARMLVFHILDKVRELVTGINPFKQLVAVNVETGIHQPVGIQNDNGINTGGTGSTTQFAVAFNSGFAATFQSTGLLGKQHGRYVSHLSGNSNFTHLLHLFLF